MAPSHTAVVFPSGVEACLLPAAHQRADEHLQPSPPGTRGMPSRVPRRLAYIRHKRCGARVTAIEHHRSLVRSRDERSSRIIRGVPFPNVEGKHAHDAMFGPQDFIAYLKKQGLWEDFRAPDGVVFFYQRWFLDKVVAKETAAGRLRPDRTPAALLSFCLVDYDTTTLGLSGGFGIGSPAAVAVMEELIAVGVTQFIGIGTAGGLQKDLEIGSIVVCDRAVRDEGVSHHYVEPAKYAATSTGLTLRLKDSLAAQGLDPRIGTTWTIDAPYRETVEELKQYQAEGVLTVDMEAAAMASVATHRRVEFAAAFAISDTLADLVWDPQFRSNAVADSLDRLYSGAVAALTRQVGTR